MQLWKETLLQETDWKFFCFIQATRLLEATEEPIGFSGII
jgi:hypothetical protein